MEENVLFSVETVIQKAHPAVAVFPVQDAEADVTAVAFPVGPVVHQKHVVTGFQIETRNGCIFSPAVAAVAVDQKHRGIRLALAFKKLTSQDQAIKGLNRNFLASPLI